ncbi:carbamoyl-phosphate synthase (glutamine-hydrolyzing) [Clostridia bacterium]|nr:carbamoyl-phosphate synthase (glutamine-hydrolyzing) [Clostridia bacterium]
MPLRNDIKKVLVIGSGPIIIGQAAEFDYAGTQACRALKQEGLEVVLVNSNPATIMTDKAMADKIYIEPLTLPVLRKIIEIEKPDSVLSTLGGQTGLTLSMQLAKEGFLDLHNVKLLGANPETIHKAEDRQAFKDTMEKIGEPCIPSKVVETLEDAVLFAEFITYPVIVRPAFTLGGTGGGIAKNEEELRDIATNGLRLSPITQVLIEKCISGWKEIEFEVIRDRKGNVITVCSMENFDPVGVHTGDSIVIAPAVTLTDREYQMLRTASLNIINELKVEGGCNCQFALHPKSYEYAVIEVNPRVSRSSALASKATGYPIAKVATRIAIGYTLDEIVNQVTGKTFACFEPSLDYVVVKFPKWAFDKFVYAKRNLGTQMKATGEIMAIGVNFEQAIMKAARSVELGIDSLNFPKLEKIETNSLLEKLPEADDERAFQIFELLKRGISTQKIHDLTMIDIWFLEKLNNLVKLEKWLSDGKLTQEKYDIAKKFGYLDDTIERIASQNLNDVETKTAVFKMVDTCAGEFKAETPYFYSTFDKENEAKEFIESKREKELLDLRRNSNALGIQKTQDDVIVKKTVIVFGSGPIRIGQGIEFDYCSVHCVWALKEAGYEAVICNNNPETVSTDFDTGDRLYFDPLTKEDVRAIIDTENPYGVVVQFGGQTAIKLTKHLVEMQKNGYTFKILGTSADSIDAAEDRERFDEVLEKCEIPRPNGFTIINETEALDAAAKLGFPVLMRPSYVLGGQNMIIAYTEADISEYIKVIIGNNASSEQNEKTLETKSQNPVLIDKYVIGTEVEVDAICDGTDFLIPGIMEHIERAGVHSGDSISVYPAQNLTTKVKETIIEYTRKLAMELKVIGLVNIQYVVDRFGNVFVIEVNPRSSRTVPYISKVTGVPMVDIATKIMLGATLKSQGYKSGLYPESEYIAVKVPVFSFEKLQDVDTMLGPEMKSTGECLGIAKNFPDALLKGLVGAGYDLEHRSINRKTGERNGVFISVRNEDKKEIIEIAEAFSTLGFDLYATSGTASILNKEMIATNSVYKISENKEPNTLTLLESGKIHYLISTSAKGRIPERDSVKMRRKAIERSICSLTSLDTARALAKVLKSRKTINDVEMVDITNI